MPYFNLSNIQSQISQGLIDLARGFPNNRRNRRREVLTRFHYRPISYANPRNFPYSSIDEHVRPLKFDIVLAFPKLSDDQVLQHAWNPYDSSPNIYVKPDDPFTFYRHPITNATDCIRGRVGYYRGFHVWKIIWPRNQRGSSAVIGVATLDAPLFSQGYVPLVGATSHSYGWDIAQNRCYHNYRATRSWMYPAINNNNNNHFCPSSAPSHFVVGSRIGVPLSSVIHNYQHHQQRPLIESSMPEEIFCILDMDEGYLAFATEDRYLGIAFRGLRRRTLFPIVSSVWGKSQVTIRYIGGLSPEPPLLTEICKKTIRRQMGESRLYRSDEFGLPRYLEKYVLDDNNNGV